MGGVAKTSDMLIVSCKEFESSKPGGASVVIVVVMLNEDRFRIRERLPA